MGATALISPAVAVTPLLRYQLSTAFFLGLRSPESGFGTGFPSGESERGAARLAQGERASVLSVIFLISYLRDVFGGGRRLFRRAGRGPFTTARGAWPGRQVLAALALIGNLRSENPEQQADQDSGPEHDTITPTKRPASRPP